MDISTPKGLFSSIAVGFAFLVGALVLTWLGIYLAGAVGSDWAFVAAIRLFMSFMPFSNTKPAIPAWPELLNTGYIFVLSILIGRLGKPSNPIRMALLTFALLIGCSQAMELLLRVAGYPRYFVIDL